MPDTIHKTIMGAARARFNKLRRSSEELHALLQDPIESVNQATMASLRSTVEDITQSFHEFNAYRNAAQTTGVMPKDRPYAVIARAEELCTHARLTPEYPCPSCIAKARSEIDAKAKPERPKENQPLANSKGSSSDTTAI